MAKKQLSIRIDEDVYGGIKKIADASRVSVAQVINHGTRLWLGMELAKAEAKQSWEWAQREDARIVAEQGLVPIEIPVPIEARQHLRNLQMEQHWEMIVEDNAKHDAHGARTATGIEAVDRELSSKNFAVKNPVADAEEKRELALAALEAVGGLSGTPVNIEPFRPAPSLESVPYIVEESAPVKLCVACECNLVTVKGKWVCDHADCGLYGTVQKGRK